MESLFTTSNQFFPFLAHFPIVVTTRVLSQLQGPPKKSCGRDISNDNKVHLETV